MHTIKAYKSKSNHESAGNAESEDPTISYPEGLLARGKTLPPRSNRTGYIERPFSIAGSSSSISKISNNNATAINLSKQAPAKLSGSHESIKKTDGDAFRSINDIRANGHALGAGAFGEAWLIDDYVYKIPKEGFAFLGVEGKSSIIERFKHAASEWNYFYNKCYGGEFKSFADAKVMKLPSDEVVLRTPYINGDDVDAKVYATSKLKDTVVTELKSMSRKIEDNGASNIKVVRGKPLVIDFDLVIFEVNDKQKAAAAMFGFL